MPGLPLILACVLSLLVGMVLAAYLFERRARLTAERAAVAERAERERVVAQRDFAMDQTRADRAVITNQARQLEEQARLLKNLERVARNPLYRDAMEDQQAIIVQAGLQIRLAREALATADLLVSQKNREVK